ncbi:MAG: ArsA family ATPase [Thermoplasmatota archaeon]
MRLQQQLDSRDLVVFMGPGGVGKTTVSAAAALDASRSRSTLVLTIDPARRLADALGVRLGSEPVEVRPGLHALMLDTKKALDDLIVRYAPDQSVMRRIFQSHFYANLSDAFAGSEEFVAMGTLYELLASKKWDLIVVDTPPSRHAIDFLAVNRKLIRVFESGVVKYLFKPTRVLRLGGGYFASVLARWTSQEYLEELSDFIVTFDEMFLEMETRVRAMQTILEDRRRSALNIVTSAEREAIDTTLHLADDVAHLGYKVESCIVNRHHPRLRGIENFAALAEPGSYRTGAVQILVDSLGAGPATAERFLDDAAAAAGFYDAIAVEEEQELARLREEIRAPVTLVPALAGSIHDLAGLERVRARLIS